MSTHANANYRFFIGAIVIFMLTLLAGGIMIYVAMESETPAMQAPSTAPSTSVELMTRAARQFYESREYRKALAIIDQIQEIDPPNDYALGARPLVLDRVLLQEPGLSRTTTEMNSDAVMAALDEKLPELKLDAVPFSDVVLILENMTRIKVSANWQAIEAAGVDRNTRITARLRDVKFRKAIEIIIRDVGSGKRPLDYSADEGQITISSADDIASKVVTNVYDVRDLSFSLPDFRNKNLVTANRELTIEIIRLIEETVASESWVDNGGRYASIRELGGQLIIT